MLGHTSVALPVLITGLLAGQAQAQTPHNVPASNVASEAKDIRDAVTLIGLQKELIVQGEQVVDSYFVGAERITFKSGARLVFSDKALKTRNNLLVAARTITMEDPAKPGVITWAMGPGPTQGPPRSGEAQGGTNASSDGEAGGQGQTGIVGGVGVNGATAPNMTIFVMSFQGAPPTIDLRGQPGGVGGQGQKGGHGGVGQHGSPATGTAFGCRSGAGYGGAGGQGGAGGPGGFGGTGGAGGTITFVSLPEAFPTLLQLVRADVGAGESGAGGPGGMAGLGGPGGSQGAPSYPFCKDEPGRRGANASSGGEGSKGDKGVAGTSGDVLYTTLSAPSFKAIFGVE